MTQNSCSTILKVLCVASALWGVTLSSGAQARSIVYDSWPSIGTYSGTTAEPNPSALTGGSLPSAVNFLELDPGVTTSEYTVYANLNMVNALPGDMYVWHATDTLSGPDGVQPYPDDQQFFVKVTSATSFQITMNDDAQSCGGASFTINATTYRSNSPCTAGTGFGQAGLDCPLCIGWNTSAFTFDVAHGKVQLESALPKGWAVAAAPEIDAYAAGSALSLFFGSMAVFAGGRRFRNRAA